MTASARALPTVCGVCSVRPTGERHRCCAGRRDGQADADVHRHSISASPTACPLRGYGRAGTEKDRLSKAVILRTGTPIPAQRTCRRRCRDAQQVRDIVAALGDETDRQTLMFTATWSADLQSLASELLVRPVRLFIGQVP